MEGREEGRKGVGEEGREEGIQFIIINSKYVGLQIASHNGVNKLINKVHFHRNGVKSMQFGCSSSTV